MSSCYDRAVFAPEELVEDEEMAKQSDEEADGFLDAASEASLPFLYRDSTTALTTVLIQDPCPLGLPEIILTRAYTGFSTSAEGFLQAEATCLTIWEWRWKLRLAECPTYK